jgi:hypothetical protein
MRIVITCLLHWSLAASPALAWSGPGHKIIASIAFRQLGADEQDKVVAILKEHPRFAEDFEAEMPDDVRAGDEATQNEWLFQQAAIWPDMLRSGPAERRAFHRSQWHYINLPHFLNDAARSQMEGRISVNLALDPPPGATLATRDMNAIQVIGFARKECADPDADAATRAVLLCWMFHNIGDIHQPLHSTALFSRRLFSDGDRGGNAVLTRQAGNLHSLRDRFPGGTANFRTARNRAIEALANPDLTALGVVAADVLDEKEWVTESHYLAVVAAYDPEVMVALRAMEDGAGTVAQIELSEDYLRAGGRIANRRVVQAGYRLGAVLKEMVAE